MNKRFLLIAFVVLVVVAGYSVLTSRSRSVGVVGNKTYSSSALHFEITYPQNYVVEEKFTSVIVSSGDKYIHISRSGTNFGDVTSYLSDLDLKNKSEVLESEQLKFNGLVFVRRLLNNLGDPAGSSLMYCVYINSQIFTFETTSPELFDELEQIAKSFSYTGK